MRERFEAFRREYEDQSDMVEMDGMYVRMFFHFAGEEHVVARLGLLQEGALIGVVPYQEPDRMFVFTHFPAIEMRVVDADERRDDEPPRIGFRVGPNA